MLGDNANVPASISATRIIAPEGLDPDVLVEMVIAEAVLNRRLGLDRDANTFLDRTPKI